MTVTTPSPDEVSRNPHLFAEKFLRIQTSRGATGNTLRTVPLRYNTLQARYLTERTPRDLILKPRQVGFSTLVQAELRRYEWTRAASTITLGKDDANTSELRRIADFYYQKLPEGFRPARRFANASLTTYPALGSQAVIAKAGSPDTGRGGTRTHFHGSEVAFWPDAQAIITGALQGGNPSWVVLESTPNGATGRFYELCMDALEGRPPWRLHFYRWFDEPAYTLPEPSEPLALSDDEGILKERYGLTDGQILWRRAKIAEIGVLDDFLQEYPEDVRTCFKKSGAGYFGSIDHVFTAPFGVEPDPSHTYVAGLDFGQAQDYTALIVIDTTSSRMVDILHMRHEQWQVMRDAVREKCKRWHVQTLVAERNSIGSVNIEALYADFSARNLDTSIVAFDMTASSKPPLMASLRTALHEKTLRLQPHDTLYHELHAAVSKQTPRGWTVESPRDGRGHGDTVVALALAWYAVQRYADRWYAL